MKLNKPTKWDNLQLSAEQGKSLDFPAADFQSLFLEGAG